MTHTLHRVGTVENLSDDFPYLAMSAKGFPNEPGSDDKMREILKIAQKHNPVNYGDMRTGNEFSTDLDEILEKVDTRSIVHAVFTNVDDAAGFAKEVAGKNFGISLVLSAPFDLAKQVAEKAGVKVHTIEYAPGIWGKKELLAENWILEITTMCGHAMISRYLVEDLTDRVKKGRMTAKAAAEEMAKQCCCGIFNPARAEKLIKKQAGV